MNLKEWWNSLPINPKKITLEELVKLTGEDSLAANQLEQLQDDYEKDPTENIGLIIISLSLGFFLGLLF